MKCFVRSYRGRHCIPSYGTSYLRVSFILNLLASGPTNSQKGEHFQFVKFDINMVNANRLHEHLHEIETIFIVKTRTL